MSEPKITKDEYLLNEYHRTVTEKQKLSKKLKSFLANLWFKEFVSPEDLCGLCGNHGVIDTRGKITSPAGVNTGIRTYCICPNGRILKRASKSSESESDYDEDTPFMKLSDYLLKRGLWDSTDFAPDDPAQSVINGVERFLNRHSYTKCDHLWTVEGKARVCLRNECGLIQVWNNNGYWDRPTEEEQTND